MNKAELTKEIEKLTSSKSLTENQTKKLEELQAQLTELESDTTTESLDDEEPKGLSRRERAQRRAQLRKDRGHSVISADESKGFNKIKYNYIVKPVIDTVDIDGTETQLWGRIFDIAIENQVNGVTSWTKYPIRVIEQDKETGTINRFFDANFSDRDISEYTDKFDLPMDTQKEMSIAKRAIAEDFKTFDWTTTKQSVIEIPSGALRYVRKDGVEVVNDSDHSLWELTSIIGL